MLWMLMYTDNNKPVSQSIESNKGIFEKKKLDQLDMKTVFYLCICGSFWHSKEVTGDSPLSDSHSIATE